jgi:hypothetical protein
MIRTTYQIVRDKYVLRLNKATNVVAVVPVGMIK